MSDQKQDVRTIVEAVLRHQAAARQIPLGKYRRITVSSGIVGADFKINRHEIIFDLAYALSGDPIKMVDRVLDTIVEHDKAKYERTARAISNARGIMMKWAAFLQRTMSPQMYEQFIFSLLPEEPAPLPVPEWMLEVMEGERMQDNGIEHRP